jgi:hypothetical protein
VTWHDVLWSDVTWRNVTWHDMTWHDMTWHYVTWRDVTWRDMTWHDMTQPNLKLTNSASGPFLKNKHLLSRSRNSPLFQEPKFHYRIHKISPPLWAWAWSVHSTHCKRFILHFNTMLPFTPGFPVVCFPRFPNTLHETLPSPIRATWSAHLIHHHNDIPCYALADACEYDNVPALYINCMEFLDKFWNFSFLERVLLTVYDVICWPLCGHNFRPTHFVQYKLMSSETWHSVGRSVGRKSWAGWRLQLLSLDM